MEPILAGLKKTTSSFGRALFFSLLVFEAVVYCVSSSSVEVRLARRCCFLLGLWMQEENELSGSHRISSGRCML